MKRNSLRVRESLARLLWQDQLTRSRSSFRPRLECLEPRRLLAVASDLASISGRVFDDVTGNGYTAGEEIAGAELALYRDNGDGLFDPGGGDTQIDTEITDAAGLYEFARLEAGDYFVLQPAQTADGRNLQRSVSPLIEIDAEAVQGEIVISIDSFDETTQLARDETNDGVPALSSVLAPDALGGERDLYVNKTSTNGAIQLSVNDPLLPDLLSFDSQQFGDGVRRVIWDGIDGDAATIDDTGLAAIDLTSDGLSTGLLLQIGADLAGGTAIVRLYSDDGAAGTAIRYSEISIPIPATGGVPETLEFIPYADFTAVGGGADLTEIGAVELEILGENNVNGTVELVGTAGPTMFAANFANFESADLSLTKTVDQTRPSVGENVTFTVTVLNSGPDTAREVVVDDLLPAGFTLVDASVSQGSYTEATGQWSVGDVANAATATLTLLATVTDAGAKTNTAEIVASEAFDSDSTPGNDVAAEDDQASVTVTPSVADLSLTKTVSDASPNVGDELVFTVTVQNAGPDEATGIVVSESFPAGVTLLEETSSQGDYDAATGLWTVGSLASAGQATLVLRGRVTSSGSGTNTAEITAARPGDPDSTPGNNVAAEDDQASVTFTPQLADLSLTKTVDQATPSVGDTVTFLITLTNTGPDTATGVEVTDTLTDGLRFVSATESGGSFDSATGVWTVPSLAAAATATLTIEAVVEALSTQSNTAEVTAIAQFDPDSTPGNGVAAEDDQASATLTPPSADVSLTKTVSNPAPNVGDEVTFVVTVQNAGPNSATGVVVTDSLPANVTLLSSFPDAANPSQGSFDTATGVWTVGTLSPTGQATLTLRARVTANGTGTNTAEVTAANPADPDSTPGNGVAGEDDQASASFTTPVADLSLTKTVDDAAPSVGDTVTFVVTLTNDGPDAATNIVVTDALSAGLDFAAASTTTGAYDPVTGLWSIDTLAEGATATLTLQAVVETLGAQSNTAEVTAVTQFDSDSTPDNDVAAEDDQATVTVTPAVADLSLTKTVSDASPNVGDEVIFTVTVQNAGPDAATGIVVRDTFPAGVTLIEETPSQGDYDAATGLWTVGSLASAGQATLVLRGRVTSSGSGTNTAEITAARPGDPDSTPGNNVAAEDDQASVTFTPQLADLSLTKTVDDADAGLGDTVTFVVTLTNTGPDTATGIAVTDTLSDGLRFVSATEAGGSFDSATGVWTIPSLAAAATATLTIEAVVEALSTQSNTAEVTAVAQFDPDSTPGNGVAAEDDQATVTVTPPSADLSLTKAVSDASPNVGSEVTFTVVVSNAGPNAVTDIVVADSLPAGLTLVANDPSVGTYDSTTGRWTIPTLAANGSAELVLRATADAAGDITNTAEILSSSLPDPDSTAGNGDPEEDDFASVTLSPELVDLALTKSLDNLTPNVGDVIAYLLTLSNEGPSTATGVAVSDALPDGVSFESATPSQGTYDPTTGIWSVGEIAPGVTPTLRIEATVGRTLGATNTAEISAVDQPDADSTPGNGEPAEDDLATATFATRVADLSLAKTVDNAAPNRNDTVRFTLTLSNSGPDAASGITIRDLLPTGLTFVSATPSSGTYDPVDGLWAVDTLAADGTATLEIVTTATAAGVVVNQAEVIATDQLDPDSTPGNGDVDEDDFAAVTVTPPVVDISVDAELDIAAPLEGEVVQIVFTANNAGPITATGLVLSTDLPEGLTLLSVQTTGGTYNAATERWTIDSLAADGQAELILTVRVDTAGPRSIPLELIELDQFDIDSTPGNGVEGEDDQTVAVLAGPRLLSKRLFLSR